MGGHDEAPEGGMDMGHEPNLVTQMSRGLTLMVVTDQLVGHEVVAEPFDVVRRARRGSRPRVSGNSKHCRNTRCPIDQGCQCELHRRCVASGIRHPTGPADLVSVQLGQSVDPTVI